MTKAKPFSRSKDLSKFIEPISDEILIEALTHKSFAFEQGGQPYDRLEFLGDALLQYIVSQYLFTKFPNALEGELTEFRQKLVSTEALAKIGAKYKLTDYLLLGEGMQRHSDQVSPKMAADAVESLIAAVYMSQGISAAQSFTELLLNLN